MGRTKSKRSVESTVGRSTPADLFSNLIYYRQGRVDGGIHSGVDSFDIPLLESFENKAPYEESDPVLAWYVEVRCKGHELVPAESIGVSERKEGLMAKLIFYRQKRYDNGIRTGLELDGDPIAERFEEGDKDRDPALIWYVDLCCEGPGVPDDPDLAERWLVDHSPLIRDGFCRFAEHLRGR